MVGFKCQLVWLLGMLWDQLYLAFGDVDQPLKLGSRCQNKTKNKRNRVLNTVF
jgi:hypothetical protein